MMSFIEDAIQYGYDPEQVLKFIGKVNPEFKKRVSNAIQYGYTPASILRDVAKYFKGSSSKKTAKAMGISPQMARNLVFNEKLDPATVIPDVMRPKESEQRLRSVIKSGLGTAAGAGIGYALGGPMGASLGSQMGKDILTPEEETKEPLQISYQGGQPPQPESASPAPTQPMQPSIVHEIGQGLDLGKLSPTQRKHFGALMATIKQLEEQGIPREDKRFKQALNQINKLKSGAMKEAPIMQEETARFEEVYPEGQQPVEEAPIQAEQIQETEIAPVEETVQKESVFPKILSGEEKASANRLLTKYGMPDISKIPVHPFEGKTVDPFKSSNIRYLSYDPKEKHLDALFSNGEGFRYAHVPEDMISEITKGATTVSSGESALRAFFQGKEGSKGAAFDKLIKKGGYVSGKLDSKFVKDKAFFDIMNADRISVVSKMVKPFYEIIEKAKIKQKMPDYREFYQEAEQLDDEAFTEFAFQVNELLKSEGKRKTKKARKEAAEKIRGRTR